MRNSWIWIGKYLIVIVAALVLGSVLGGIEPFHSTTLGSARIGAGALVQFIAHGGALALLWALGFRVAAQLRQGNGRASHVASPVLALTTLIVAASFYAVLLQFTAPFLAANLRPILDWAFILGILAAAGWLLWALFVHAEPLLAAAPDRTYPSGGTVPPGERRG